MSLQSDANGEYVDLGTIGSWSPNPSTWLMWVYIPSDPGAIVNTFAEKVGSGSERISLHYIGGGGALDVMRVVITGTSALDYRSEAGDITYAGWLFLAYVIDTSAADDNRVLFYKGDLSTPATLSTPSLTTEGSGYDSTTSTLRVLNASGADDEPMNGRMAKIAAWDSVLSAARIKGLQFAPHWNDGVPRFYYELGFNGTGSQADWSGNGNAGTVTNATIADHVPLGPPFGFDLGWQGAFTAARVSPVYPGRRHPSRNVLLRL